jgi:hypothetical protein
MEEKSIGFIDFFSKAPDHRIKRGKLHAVEEILLMAKHRVEVLMMRTELSNWLMLLPARWGLF